MYVKEIREDDNMVVADNIILAVLRRLNMEFSETQWYYLNNDIVQILEDSVFTIDPEEIRRECADRAIAWYRAGQLIPAHKDSFAIKQLRAAILGAEPAQDDGEPEVGDIVYHEDRIRAWDYADEEMKGKYINKVIVLMRAAEVKRRIEEVKE